LKKGKKYEHSITSRSLGVEEKTTQGVGGLVNPFPSLMLVLFRGNAKNYVHKY